MTAKSILITGCSSGIGLKAALLLKQRGYRVFATARKEQDVNALKEQGLESFLLDVNNTESMHQALEQILLQTGGTLDALFNNAAYLQAGAIEDLTRDMDRAQFETNVFGAMELIRLVLPIMRRQDHGRIIQNSSILGIITIPYYAAYNASKFALEGYSNTLRQELRGTPIHVSIICPGPTRSNLRANAYQHYQNTLANQPESIHRAAYNKLEETYFKPTKMNQKITVDPEVVVKKLLHALESKHPHAHYYVGFPAHLFAFLRRILPDSALDWVLSKIK